MLLRFSVLALLFISCKEQVIEPVVEETQAQRVYDIIYDHGYDPDRAFNYELPVIAEYDIDEFVWPSSVRGIRNNNWGNIEKGADWVGLGDDKDVRFANYEHPIFGLRALMVITYNYNARHGIKTVDQWANRWAPPHENRTDKYASYLVGRTGSNTIDFSDYYYMREFTRAVCEMENGRNRIDEVWDDTFFRVAWIIRERTK